MWNINTKLMCNKHLLGEHLEMHMFAGCLAKGKSIKGYIEKGLVEVHNIKKRHDELVEEMKDRGMKHVKPMPKFKEYKAGEIDVKKSYEDLIDRCEACSIIAEVLDMNGNPYRLKGKK